MILLIQLTQLRRHCEVCISKSWYWYWSRQYRAIGSPIPRGDATHTGVIPFYKLFQSAVKSCSQGGVRGGAATLYYPVWHLEVEDLIVLKNNKGTEDNRVRHMDYGVSFNKLMYERLLTGGDITLFLT